MRPNGAIYLQMLVDRWHRHAAQLDHPAVELTVEELSPVLSTFNSLRAAGYQFDPTLTAIMHHLQLQVLDRVDPVSEIWGDDDPDTDVSVDT